MVRAELWLLLPRWANISGAPGQVGRSLPDMFQDLTNLSLPPRQLRRLQTLDEVSTPSIVWSVPFKNITECDLHYHLPQISSISSPPESEREHDTAAQTGTVPMSTVTVARTISALGRSKTHQELDWMGLTPWMKTRTQWRSWNPEITSMTETLKSPRYRIFVYKYHLSGKYDKLWFDMYIIGL